MVKKTGDELLVPKEKIETLTTISHRKATQLNKKPRILSQKQQENVDRLVEATRARWKKYHAEKEEMERLELEKKLETYAKVKVLPKRPYTKGKKIQEPINQVVQEEQEQEQEEEEYEAPVVKKAPRKKVQKQEEESEEDDDVIQKTRKAVKLVETVNKLDDAISKLKVSGGRYTAILDRFKF